MIWDPRGGAIFRSFYIELSSNYFYAAILSFDCANSYLPKLSDPKPGESSWHIELRFLSSRIRREDYPSGLRDGE